MNNPLNQIHINTSFLNEMLNLEDQIDREAAADYANEIQDLANQMTDILRELLIELRSARSSTDGLVDGYVIVNDILDDLAEIIQAYDANIALQDVPKVNMDAKDFYQLMMNLISSALRNSQDNVKPKVTIGAEKNGEMLTLFIKDNGVALDEEYKAQMFNVFNTKGGHAKMSVLAKGLRDCKKIVEAYSGPIWLESNPDTFGLTFFVSIPNS